MTIKTATYEGKSGWYDDATSEFLSADEWKPATYEGKSGIFNSKTQEFQEISTGTTSSPKMPNQTMGEYLQGLLGKITPYTRPTLEYGGALLGGILGGGPMTPTGIASTGLMYAAGRKGADLLEQLAGQKSPKDFLTEVSETGKDFVGGTLAEMGSQGLTETIKGVGRAIAQSDWPKRWMGRAIRTPLSEAWKRVIPTKDFTKRMEVVDNMLKDGVLANERGLAQSVHTINDLDTAIQREVKGLQTKFESYGGRTPSDRSKLGDLESVLSRRVDVHDEYLRTKLEMDKISKYTNEDYMRMTDAQKAQIRNTQKRYGELQTELTSIDAEAKAIQSRQAKMGGGPNPYETPISRLTAPLNRVKMEAFYSRNGISNLEEIKAFEHDLIRMGGIHGSVSPEGLQMIKQQLYKSADYDRAKPLLNATGRFTEEATKAVASVAMEELERMAPDTIGVLNKKMGAYLDIKKAIENTLARFNASSELTTMGTKILAIKNLGLAALEIVTGTPGVRSRIALALKGLGDIKSKSMMKGALLPVIRSDSGGQQ